MKHNNTFSFSAISSFKSCPRAYQYKYIDKQEEAFLSIEGHMGKSVHGSLEWAYKRIKEAKEEQLKEVLKRYHQIFWNQEPLEKIKVIKENKNFDDYFGMGKAYITDYFKRVFPKDTSETLYLEHKFKINLSRDVSYKGVIDRVARKDDGTLQVIDFKTGKVDHPLENLQLPSYALYIFDHNIENTIELVIEDLRKNRSLVCKFLRKDSMDIRNQLLKDIHKILNTEIFNTKPSILCSWCGYNQICDHPHESVSSTIYQKKPPIHKNEENYDFSCPQCGGELLRRKGKFGEFYGCRNYPECKYTYNIESSNTKNPGFDSPIQAKDICPECGSLLKERSGKYGPFIGCTGYPQCRFTREIDKEN
jgi:DNA topoisomerase-1